MFQTIVLDGRKTRKKAVQNRKRKSDARKNLLRILKMWQPNGPVVVLLVLVDSIIAQISIKSRQLIMMTEI